MRIFTLNYKKKIYVNLKKNEYERAFPIGPSDELLQDIEFFENFSGTVYSIMLLQNAIKYEKVKEIIENFPNGISNIKNMAQLNELKYANILSGNIKLNNFIIPDKYIIFTPEYGIWPNILHNFNVNTENISAELIGNCGIYNNQSEYFCTIHNIFPLLHIASIFYDNNN